MRSWSRLAGSFRRDHALRHDDANRVTPLTRDGVTDDYVYDTSGHRIRDHLPEAECWAYAYDD
jgi:YD repeat-containing protein